MLTPQRNGGIKINAFLIYFYIPIFSAFLMVFFIFPLFVSKSTKLIMVYFCALKDLNIFNLIIFCGNFLWLMRNYMNIYFRNINNKYMLVLFVFKE